MKSARLLQAFSAGILHQAIIRRENSLSQTRQRVLSGLASRRLMAIGFPHWEQIPYLPASIRCNASKASVARYADKPNQVNLGLSATILRNRILCPANHILSYLRDIFSPPITLFVLPCSGKELLII